MPAPRRNKSLREPQARRGDPSEGASLLSPRAGRSCDTPKHQSHKRIYPSSTQGQALTLSNWPVLNSFIPDLNTRNPSTLLEHFSGKHRESQRGILGAWGPSGGGHTPRCGATVSLRSLAGTACLSLPTDCRGCALYSALVRCFGVEGAAEGPFPHSSWGGGGDGVISRGPLLPRGQWTRQTGWLHSLNEGSRRQS